LGDLKGGDHQKDLGVDGWTTGFEDMDWIHWAQDRDRWWALVNTVMNLRVPYNVGNFLTSLASQEGLCSMEFVS
jgi:hypothetical protein